MSASAKRKIVKGISLCADPAREPCFRVAQLDDEMQKFESAMSKDSMREKLHRHMNNEMGALEIAAQCLADFPESPWELRLQLARQAFDESRHVHALHRRLRQLGGYKGEFPIGNFEWAVTNMCDTLAARLAIQNRTFEAGQMDLLGALRQIWRSAGDETTAEVLEHILADEINHVRFANQWIRKLVQADRRLLFKVASAIRFLADTNTALSGEPGVSTEETPVQKHMKLGINVEDRRHADFSDDEINEILRQAGMSSLVTEGAHV
jgi:uncharacterized ferritin-like protein (DUF455 family)